MPRKKRLEGLTFGRLTVIKEVASPNIWWRCRCECGRMARVCSENLLSGRTASCGCLRADIITRRCRKHGMCGTPEYDAWQSAKARCYNLKNKHYKDYGGRGIAMCDEWLTSFAAFLAHVGKKPTPMHSLDRIDVDCGYEPGNVRWADNIVQAGNRRGTLIYDGVSAAEHERRIGLKEGTIKSRTRRGWPLEKAIFTPILTRWSRQAIKK